MSKRKKITKKTPPEIQKILDRLEGGQPSDTLCIFIPSETRDKKPVHDQDLWADKALRLFGRLYTGATAFTNLKGIYHPNDKVGPLLDKPIMVQTLTNRARVSDAKNLKSLSDFCHRMGKKTNQHSIGLIVNDYYIDVEIDHGS